MPLPHAAFLRGHGSQGLSFGAAVKLARACSELVVAHVLFPACEWSLTMVSGVGPPDPPADPLGHLLLLRWLKDRLTDCLGLSLFGSCFN